MHVARLVIVLLIIFAVVAAYNPQVREQAAKTWEQVKPAVVGVTNSIYVAIRNIINSNTSDSGVDEQPAPGPGLDFQRIVTLHSGAVL